MRWKERIGVRLTHEKDYVMKTSYLIEKVNVVNSILKPSSNRSPSFFMLVQTVKIGHTKSMLL